MPRCGDDRLKLPIVVEATNGGFRSSSVMTSYVFSEPVYDFEVTIVGGPDHGVSRTAFRTILVQSFVLHTFIRGCGCMRPLCESLEVGRVYGKERTNQFCVRKCKHSNPDIRDDIQ